MAEIKGLAAEKKYLGLFGIMIAVSAMTQYAALSMSQSVSVIIIALFISSTFLFWNMRLAFGFLGVSLLMLFGVLDIAHLLEFASLDIIIFLIGMMIIVGYLENNHFFEFVIGKLIKRIGDSGKKLVVVLLLLAAISAAMVDEVTSILIMTSIVIHITTRYKVNPIPFVLMTVFATNIGSSATVVGNPVGVMVALKGGLTFTDFLRWATPISAVSLIVGILVMLVLFKKEISEFDANIKKDYKEEKDDEEEKDHRTAAMLFIFTIVGLIFHSQIEKFLHLEKNTLLIGVALAGAGIAMLLSKDEASTLVERRVDWWTLMFFMFLFASVGSLEFTGVIDIIAEYIRSLTGGSMTTTITIIMLFSGILSAMLDNVLAVAISIPIIENLALTSNAFPLWWSLLFAATLFGNLTFIGSTANIVALGVLNKRKLGHIGFKEWIKPGFVVTVATVVVAFTMIIMQLPLMLLV